MKTFYLKNPLSHDVSTQYNLDGTVIPLTASAESITKFYNETLYRHIREYLVTEIINTRNLWNFDEERQKIRDDIEVKV